MSNEHRDVAIVGTTVVVGGGAVAGSTAASNSAPIIAFIGVVVVAILTAVTANRRQERALVAERERLDDRLRHERRQADIADLRVVLEEALAAADRAFNTRMQNQVLGVTSSPGSGEATRAVSTALDRLYVRLDRESELVQAYIAMHNTLTIPPTKTWDADAWSRAYHDFVRHARTRVGSETDSTVAGALE